MKKLFILCIMMFLTNIINAQTIKELEERHQSVVKDHTSPKKSFSDKSVDAFTPEDDTWGLGYSYSQTFPLSLSINYTHSYLFIATEVGFNLDGKKYTSKEYNPFGYWVLSPGGYCRFLSINCGVGFMASSYMENQTYTENSSSETDNISTSVNSYISIKEGMKLNFMLKPSITGYIPISDEDFYITINAGYNYIPKFKELNGWSFGVGFQWVIL